MLRHFLNATARTSSRSLFANPLSSGGLNFFSSTALTSFRSLLAKPNAPVYVSSLRSLSGQKLCASEMQLASAMKGARTVLFWILGVYFFGFIIETSVRGSIARPDQSMDQPAKQLTSIVPLATREPDLREWTRANMEYKMIDRRGSEMPPSTYFWSKAIVAPETMPKLKEILDELKSCGTRVEESDNYYFVDANVDRKKKRFAELMIWLEEPGHKYFREEEKREKNRAAGGGGYARDEYSWSGSTAASNKPPGLPKPRRTDESRYMGS